MLGSMLKEHQRKQERLKAVVETKRALAEQSVEASVSKSVEDLNRGIAEAYLNQHKLDAEARKLQTNVEKLSKQAQQWIILCNGLNTAVKDLGDISCWSKAIENDVSSIADALEKAYGARPGTSETNNQ